MKYLSTIFLLANLLLGAIINVPDDQPTIQEGIDATVDGDTVLVQPGTYVENINFNGHNITLGSLFIMTGDTSYVSQTVIDGNQNGSVVILQNGENSTTTVNGFKITNGVAENGSGILLSNSSLNVKNMLIINNPGDVCQANGGGIASINGNLYIENSTISYNTAGFGGGVYCHNSELDIQNSSILYNITSCGNGVGGGIYTLMGTASIHNSLIKGNEGWGWSDPSGGLHSNGTDLSLTETIFENNAAGNMWGPGFSVFLYGSSSCNFNDVSVNSNECGGIRMEVSNPFFDNVSITDNTGHGLSCYQSSPNLTNVLISGNNGRGISCHDSNPTYQDVEVIGNSGRGLFYTLYQSQDSVVISNILISENYGGIYCQDQNHVTLNDVTIINNSTVDYGGGIFFENSPSDLSDVTITNNSANLEGGGIYSQNSALTFSIDDRCNIISNHVTGHSLGMDIYSNNSQTVVADTFTVLSPTDYYATPINNFEFDIINAIQQTIDADLYVSSNGDDTNNGLTTETPLKTILHALSLIQVDDSSTRNIYVASGTYSPSITGELFPIDVISNVNLVGYGNDDVILDAESTDNVIRFSNIDNSSISLLRITGGNNESEGGGIYCFNSSPVITDVTITGNTSQYGGGIKCVDSNPVIDNCIISENTAMGTYGFGGGLYFSNSEPLLIELTVTNNAADGPNGYGGGVYCDATNVYAMNTVVTNNTASRYGGGIYLWNSTEPLFTNSLVAGNTATEKGGGFYCIQSSPMLTNATVVDNTAENAGGIFCWNSSHPNLKNAILWNNLPQGVGFSHSSAPNSITLSYSDIQGGETDIITNENGEVFWLVGNIDADPHFDIEGENPYALTENSPCIDSGDPDSPQDPDGTYADMGAFYFHHVLEDDPAHFNYILNGQLENYMNFADTAGYSIESHIIIETIDNADAGDEIGLLDYNGLINFGTCDDQYGEILVGAGIWHGGPLDITAYGSMDFCDNPDIEYGQYPGWVEGNPIYILYWRASEDQVYMGDYDDESGVLSWAPMDQIIPLVIPSSPSSYDVNNDLSTDILDVVLTIEFILGTTEFSEGQFASADTNSDGSVDILDIVTIIDFILNS
ncbi:MAG: right-handed parallel beta-helix repeat-containing protein [Candidatus Marinimicrobia bacterium]|nr:right-handed parallel beta-helix repeat-containing protein [Candidatus Neomarinimicrobiota bacterium]